MVGGTYLEVRRVDASSQPFEERQCCILQVVRLYPVKYLLDFVDEQQLLLRRDRRPELEQRANDARRERRILLQELRDTVAELRVEDGHMRDLVQRQQHLLQKLFVLLLERQRETVDDGAEDFEQLGDAVVAVRLVDEAVEYVVDGAADERAKRHKVAVDAMKDRLHGHGHGHGT